MKVYVLAPNENWIVDRFVREWYEHNGAVSTRNPYKADVIWLMADWCWKRIPRSLLDQRWVIASIHHLVPEKLDSNALSELSFRSHYVDRYHVPCEKTAEQVRALGHSKPMLVKPFWVNGKMWRSTSRGFRTKLGISDDVFLIGSFQRDTEGHDLISPKLEKGPDRFCDAVEILAKTRPVQVLLGGWRRQYVMGRLNRANIPYHYLELPDFETLNQMYNALDLYVVGSRYEGGPQSIFECAAARVPIISTDVGVASEILHPNAIIDQFMNDVPKIVERLSEVEIDYAHEKVSELLIPDGFSPFLEFLEDLCES